MNHQCFKGKINPVFEKYDKITLNHIKKSIVKKVLSQYPPNSTYLQNVKKLVSALKNNIVSPENEVLFLKNETETKIQLISSLIPTQPLTQSNVLGKS